MNTDIKVYAKILARRLMMVLPSIIHPDQVGFVIERQGPDATKRVLNLLEIVEARGTPSLF